jgi:type IV secretory pathway VirB10-like protein
MKILAGTIAALLLLGIALWRPWENAAPPPAPVSAPVAANTAPAPTANRESPSEPDVTPVPPPPPPPLATDLSKLTPEELQRVRDAVDNVELTLRDYAVALDGNPVGTNAEITAALRGDNAKQLKLDLPSGSTVNAAGELCDPWGTAWFFHQLSAKKMELRSAGPDRKIYTEDDFVR